MKMEASIVVWVYVLFLVAGGVMGFVKAGSRVSLVVSILCALPLAVSAAGFLPWWVAPMGMGLLGVFFAVRAYRGRKMIPGIPMAVLSVLGLGAFLGIQMAGGV